VVIRIGGIVELCSEKRVGILTGKFCGLIDRALHALSFRSASDLRAQGAHDHGFFLGKTLWDKKNDPIAAVDADQRQSNSCVPGGSFHDHAAAFQPPLLLGTLDDSNRGAVFYAASRVQVLQLDIDPR
jgi:hypothetical protein